MADVNDELVANRQPINDQSHGRERRCGDLASRRHVAEQLVGLQGQVMAHVASVVTKKRPRMLPGLKSVRSAHALVGQTRCTRVAIQATHFSKGFEVRKARNPSRLTVMPAQARVRWQVELLARLGRHRMS